MAGWVSSLLLCLPFAAAAQVSTNAQVLTAQPPPERAVAGNYIGEPGIPPEMLTSGFLTAHPDIRWRREASYSYNRKEYDLAMDQFTRAARYADKPSQAMIAEMYWKGLGVPQDRELGYAWMDLAAERMYPNFVIKRERYWELLDANQRRKAIERGQGLLAEYGDDAAKPRLAKVLRQAKRETTGSHAGFVGGGLKIIPMTGPLAGTGITMSPEEYYAPKFWNPQEYFTAQDAEWGSPKHGQVNVGELENVAPAKQESAPESEATPEP
ncbi:MAG: sel1 repeat family protein [Luteimonas sp.]|nr:sel1 repeat family protein [Luteimonas sp.]